jgi:integrase
MGRPRADLPKPVYEGSSFVVRFLHPVQRRIVRLNLGPDQDAAQTTRTKLNRLFLDPGAWQVKPADMDETTWALWLGEEDEIAPVPKLSIRTAGGKWQTLLESKQAARILALEKEVRGLQRELKTYRRKKYPGTESPTLEAAKTQWLADYKGRDKGHVATIKSDLTRFVKEFNPTTKVDAMEGQERNIDIWLRGLVDTRKGSPTKGTKLSPGRRQSMRRHILRFLEDAGASMDRKAVPTPGTKEIRAARGRIRWLERSQAEALAAQLPPYWADLFRVQVGLGLRPDELITLKRADFSPDFTLLTLSPLSYTLKKQPVNLTLKQGSRSIKVPEKVREIIKRRLDACPYVFPRLERRQDKGGGISFVEQATPWVTAQWYNKLYARALTNARTAANAAAAADTARIPFKVDCRIGRRTCASLLLRSGMNVESVAAILGDDPDTVREHYAAILPHEVNPAAAAL